MPALQVKDCPADVYERLRKCAEEENRSISQQTLTIIEDYLAMRDRMRASAEKRPGDAPLIPFSSTASANDDPPIRVRFRPIYGPEANDGIDYAKRHREAFERIAALPPLPRMEGMPDAAELLRQIREEEAR